LEFIVRILFTGLMAFIPSEDGTELDVVLLNVDHAHHLTDGSKLDQHKPLILARAGGCTGQCPTDDVAVAKYLYADKSESAAVDSLQQAVDGGGVWPLAGSNLSIVKGDTSDPELPALDIVDDLTTGIVPTTALEREDTRWIARLSEICPTCTLDESVLSAQPPGLVAARLKLRSGKFFTYTVARIGSEVTPVHFKRLDGTGNASPYTQALASWVAVDIEVSADSIELVEESFTGGPGRSMRLVPDSEGRVEIAVLNLPPFVPPASPSNDAPQVGKHWEKYYELAENPPAVAERLVPLPGAAPGTPSYPEVDWQTIHPQEAMWSELLNKLRLDVGRGIYDRTLCPPLIP